MTKRAKKLSDAISTLAIEFLQEGNFTAASQLHVVGNTLRADPKTLDKFAGILEEAFKKGK